MAKIQWYAEAGEQRQILQRRGLTLGYVHSDKDLLKVDTDTQQWQDDQAVLLPGLLAASLTDSSAEIRRTEQWVTRVLEGDYPSDCLPKGNERFVLSSCSEEDHDRQAIEKMYFDDQQLPEYEDDQPWCKASWLSFDDEDASLRFRFSFGMEGFEDVAARPQLQASAADLCSRVFPESHLITEHTKLKSIMSTILGKKPAYVERIVYFNAPNGGAQMHHDVERGHAGVVYAQLSGHTFWLALAKPLLVQEIMRFCQQYDPAEALFDDARSQQAFRQLVGDSRAIAASLDEDDHELLEALMDRHPPFIGHMVAAGYAYVLAPGDVLLLPQRDLATCVWHTVFCLGEIMGEALSFAVRAKV